MAVQYTQVVFIIIGATLVGVETTWQIGLAVSLLANAVMPAQQR